jgi:hypothetical protein
MACRCVAGLSGLGCRRARVTCLGERGGSSTMPPTGELRNGTSIGHHIGRQLSPRVAVAALSARNGPVHVARGPCIGSCSERFQGQCERTGKAHEAMSVPFHKVTGCLPRHEHQRWRKGCFPRLRGKHGPSARCTPRYQPRVWQPASSKYL